MGKLFKILAGTALLGVTAPACAQEVIVTGSRRTYDNNASGSGYLNNAMVATGQPVIRLKRTADYAVLQVRILGDTRDAKQRRDDLKAMIRGAIALAGKSGIELARGDYVVTPLTLANYEELEFRGDGRPDTDQTWFLIKTRLGPDTTFPAARDKLMKFIDAVPKVGRSNLTPAGETTLSVVDPDQYRAQIIALIATDAATSSAAFGPGYSVAVTGLDRPVEWSRAGPTEVFLYLPSSYTVRKD